MFKLSSQTYGLGIALHSLVVAGVFSLVSWGGGNALVKSAAADDEMVELPRIDVNAVKAVPPEPTYFPDEAHNLNAMKPDAGNPDGDEAMIGSMVMEPNPAYPDGSALTRLKALQKKEVREIREDAAGKNFGGLENKLETMPQSPVLEPQAAWLVGPSTASKLSDGDPQGCLALNEFSNDFIMGIHASGKEVLGITVDTRQSVFKEGEVYPVAMSLGDDSFALMALGSNQSTIAISLEDVPAFSYKAKKVGAIRLVIGATPMYFSTTGLADGLTRLEKCLNGRMAKTIKVENSTSGKAVVQGLPANADYFAPNYEPDSIDPMEIKRSGKRVPIALAVTELIPSGYRFVIERGIDPMLKVSWEQGPVWIEVLAQAMRQHDLYVHLDDKVVAISKTAPTVKSDVPEGLRERYSTIVSENPDMDYDAMPAMPMTYDEMGEWTAEKGETLDAILQKWSKQAGVKLVLDIDQDFKLDAPYFYEGRFEDAVHTLMGRFEGEGSLPRMMFKSPMAGSGGFSDAQLRAAASSSSRLTRYSDLLGKPVPQLEKIGRMPSKNYNAMPAAPAVNTNTWRGLEGASLRDILEKWSDKAGVDLVWDMDQMMELKESVKMQGSFTDAVTGILQQYAGDTLRPVAQLNNDPMTRQQTLIIRLAGKASNLQNKKDADTKDNSKDD